MTVAEDFDRMSRWGSLAATWFRKASLVLSRLQRVSSPEIRWVAGYEAARLLTSVLSDAESLVVGIVDEDQLGDVGDAARRLSAQVRGHQLALKLENVEGRTPEEAAAFRAKAAELRRP